MNVRQVAAASSADVLPSRICATPLEAPPGTRVVYTQVFDNSSQNKANPNPDEEVTWGEQTWQEMVFGVIRYRNVAEDPAPAKPQTSQEELFSGPGA